jgi:hypothetical protein
MNKGDVIREGFLKKHEGVMSSSTDIYRLLASTRRLQKSEGKK